MSAARSVSMPFGRPPPVSEAGVTVVPAELWIQIIGELPSHYQRSCLSVSKLFHDISLQYVFATINVRLGLLKDNYLADDEQWCLLQDEVQMEAEAAISRSCELLRHIVRFPRSCLAQAVRNVSMRAYSYEGVSPPEELLNALEEALSVLRLRRFAWYGCHPMPRQQVFETLFTASGETLEDIVLPAGLELVDHTPVLTFPHLKSLSFLNRYGDCYQPLGEKDPIFDSMSQTITKASSSLRSLGIFGEVLRKCNIHRFSALVELTLVLLNDIGAVGTIFTHSSRLRSLTLYICDQCSGDLTSVLRPHSDALPLLTVFRLSYTQLSRDDAEVVAAFLRKKLLLERLDFGHYSPCIDDLGPVLEILPELPRLRVLGYALDSGWGFYGPIRDDLLHLGRCIPHGLTALCLWVSAQEGLATIAETDWIQFFRGLESCRFIHVATDRDYASARALHRTVASHPPPSAELVGFNAHLRWVERREPGTGRVVAYGGRWPLSKVYCRTAGEFDGCEEWAWLLKDLELRLMLCPPQWQSSVDPTLLLSKKR